MPTVSSALASVARVGCLGSSSWDGQFRLWDLAAGRALLTASGCSRQVSFDAGDRRIAYVQRGHQGGLLALTPSSTFHYLNCRVSQNRGSWSVDVSPDGRLLVPPLLRASGCGMSNRPGRPFLLPAGPCRRSYSRPMEPA